MIRYIHCQKCHDADPMTLYPEDRDQGFSMRTKAITAKKPAAHSVKFLRLEGAVQREQSVVTLSSLFCDRCAAPIQDGDRAYAITMWREQREGTPGDWEKDFSV